MTTTTLVVAKGSGLMKLEPATRDLATRLERARQTLNEKMARAQAEYRETCRRAVMFNEQIPGQAENGHPVESSQHEGA